MATLHRFSLAAEPFAFGVLATDGLGLCRQSKMEGLAYVPVLGGGGGGGVQSRSMKAAGFVFEGTQLKLSTSSAQPCHLQTLITVDQSLDIEIDLKKFS